MSEASLKLALVADNAEPLAFAWRQAKVDLHADGVHEQREPTGHAKTQTKSGRDLCVLVEARFDGDPAIVGAVNGNALREVAYYIGEGVRDRGCEPWDIENLKNFVNPRIFSLSKFIV